MQNLIPFVEPLFIATTALCFFLLLKAAKFNRTLLLVSGLWLSLQIIVANTGFYLNTKTIPPRMLFMVMPPLASILILFTSHKGKEFINSFSLKRLTLIHVIRIPVELCLYLLFLKGTVPELMTFAGKNFDIISGITAPLVYFFGFVKPVLSKRVMIAWNFLCISLLLNVVIRALLSVPYSFQQFAFDHPNVAVLNAPFVWLPAFLVPVVLFANILSIKKLWREPQTKAALKQQNQAVYQ